MIVFKSPLLNKIVKKLHDAFRFWFPHKYFKYSSRFFNLTPQKIESAWTLFGNTDRFDIFPYDSKTGRGFALILDNKLAFFFRQYGNAFRYDGMEMGEYRNGDITIFDSIEKTKKGQEFRILDDKRTRERKREKEKNENRAAST